MSIITPRGAGHDSSASVLIFVRHGETDANVVGRIDYDTAGESLNARGRQQAQAVATYLARDLRARQILVHTVYTSDQNRALETAQVIADALGVRITVHPGLRELRVGTTPEMSLDEVLRAWQQYAEGARRDPDFHLPGGESPRQLTARIAHTLQEIIATLAGRHAIIVSHQGTLSTGIAFLLNALDRWRDYQMANCGVTRIRLTTPPTLEVLNETAYLAEIGTAVWQPTSPSGS